MNKYYLEALILSTVLVFGTGLAFSNLLLSNASVTYSESTDEQRSHLNKMKVRAPYWSYPVVFTVVPNAFKESQGDPHVYHVGSLSGHSTYVWGQSESSSNVFPKSGKFFNIPLDTPHQLDSRLNTVATGALPKDEAILKRCGTYIWVSSEPITFDEIKAKVSQWTYPAKKSQAPVKK